jgi:polar amino acid transport system substrate-binding protein
MSSPLRRSLIAAAALGASLLLVTGCTGGPAASPNALSKAPTPDSSYLEKLGWKPTENSLPNLACTDDSYAKAVQKGVTLGTYSAAPYEYVDSKTNKQAGLDWEINMAVLKYLGITKYKIVTLQWEGMIPALNSSRIDVITGNIHETPDRLKNIAFTSPAWWYGSSLMVQKENPKKVVSWKDLTRSDVTVGVVNGSQSQTYLEGIGANITPYQDANSMFAGLAGGRQDVVVDDAPKEASYIKSNPDSNLMIQRASDVPPPELLANYARYGIRKADCTLNGAYSRALSELRDHGVITKILKEYGLEENLFEPQYRP